jgi:hypothetical protein
VWAANIAAARARCVEVLRYVLSMVSDAEVTGDTKELAMCHLLLADVSLTLTDDSPLALSDNESLAVSYDGINDRL